MNGAENLFFPDIVHRSGYGTADRQSPFISPCVLAAMIPIHGSDA